MDVADDEDHRHQQDDDLDRVIDEEVERTTPGGLGVDAEAREHRGDEVAQPLHFQQLVKDERADFLHDPPQISDRYRSI